MRKPQKILRFKYLVSTIFLSFGAFFAKLLLLTHSEFLSRHGKSKLLSHCASASV